MEILKGFGSLFYIVNPSETVVEKLEDLPHGEYVRKAIPYFVTLIFLEYAVQIYTNKRRTRLNDGIISISNGLHLVCQGLLFKGAEHFIYIKIYENWRVAELPWDSAWTWYFTLIGVDLGYYWAHRAGHEINFFWAQHQVHHSSEEYNLTTALRQAGFQSWVHWMFYLPLAFFVPPQIFLIHEQFNVLFQFWIHTEVIESLGPLEWVLNTPKHHRLPNTIGKILFYSAQIFSSIYTSFLYFLCNRYCLDKNYAGVLIIWDRMFGTFAEEKPGEKIIYGLVEDVKSFNPFWLQTFYYSKIWNRMKQYENWRDKISVLLNGPGWAGPGSPRLGDINDVPEIPDREIYDVPLHTWKNVYAGLHFAIILAIFSFLAENELMFSQTTVIFVVTFILFSLTSIGFVLENRIVGGMTEISRSAVIILYVLLTPGVGPVFRLLINGLYGLSIGLWSIQLVFSNNKADYGHKNGIRNGLSTKKSK